jgi:hypothetical protein
MNKSYFSYKVEPQGFHFVDTDFLLSQPINKSTVEANVVKKLHAFQLQADKGSFIYVIREGHLYVEGWAYKNQFKQPLGVLLISSS